MSVPRSKRKPKLAQTHKTPDTAAAAKFQRSCRRRADCRNELLFAEYRWLNDQQTNVTITTTATK